MRFQEVSNSSFRRPDLVSKSEFWSQDMVFSEGQKVTQDDVFRVLKSVKVGDSAGEKRPILQSRTEKSDLQKVIY